MGDAVSCGPGLMTKLFSFSAIINSTLRMSSSGTSCTLIKAEVVLIHVGESDSRTSTSFDLTSLVTESIVIHFQKILKITLEISLYFFFLIAEKPVQSG